LVAGVQRNLAGSCLGLRSPIERFQDNLDITAFLVQNQSQ
jgi:hypothetical protein